MRGIYVSGGLLETRGRWRVTGNKGKEASECPGEMLGMFCLSQWPLSQKLSLVMHNGEGAEVVNAYHTLLYLVTRASAKNWKEV